MPRKKIIITEDMAKRLVIEEIASKIDVSSLANSKEFKDAVQKAIKNDRDVNDEIEKKVRKIVADAVKTLFRGLWERNNFWTGLITNK